MELIILKNGKVFARATDEGVGEYTLDIVENLPEYPAITERGKTYYLELVDGVYEWLEEEKQISDDEALDIILGGVQA